MHVHMYFLYYNIHANMHVLSVSKLQQLVQSKDYCLRGALWGEYVYNPLQCQEHLSVYRTPAANVVLNTITYIVLNCLSGHS